MSSDARDRRRASEEPAAPTGVLTPREPARDVPPPGVAPDQPPDGAPPTAEDAPAVLTPQTARPASDAADGSGGATPPPRLADGTELVGRFEDSGFKDPPYIARRRDGQMVQMPAMLYALAEVIDGEADEAALARRFSRSIQRQVEPDMVGTLIDKQLRPLGIVALADGSTPALKKVDPLLALKFRTKVVPKGLVRALTTVFEPLFLPAVVVVVVLAFLVLDGWLFGIHGISQSLRGVIYDPSLLFMLVGGVVLATAFHEMGHATGTRYGGAEPGVMGVGVYIVWPAFYTDITDAYRLGKAGRLRADLGGMYFNAIYALAVAGVYAVTRFEPLLLLIVLQTFTIVQQSLPLLRLDGFYIVSDLTGVPDMLTRIKPVLLGLVPGREADPRVTELKPWVRGVVTGYVCTVVPVIALLFVVMLIHAPRAFATGYDSFAVHCARVGPDLSHGATGKGILDVFEMLVLLLPLVGMVYTTGRVGTRAGVGAWNWSSAHPARRGSLVLGTGAAAAAVAFLWWPHGEYRPIQPTEKGTLASALRSLRDLPTGHAALTPKRVRQLGGAPFEHDTGAPADPSVKRTGRDTKTSPASGTTTTGTRTTGTPTATEPGVATTPSSAAAPSATTSTPAAGAAAPAAPGAPPAAAPPGAPTAPGAAPPSGTTTGPASTPPAGTTTTASPTTPTTTPTTTTPPGTTTATTPTTP